ncbi:GNAT family N-acetyltransferase [Anaerocolumna chitinilytica]|uniref:N-acetyltransferase domain-containing protein n=1 Tax=Anaerocolumna chitinilytica TaxID=1727145 RepID=A0A7I8DN40_9FIRM|nr:GNAT family protein [Anaerocolumna chitinilytica]BCJ99799.1 hypothetical protein bsdcttw_28400 [Anaerocolumna chitinilytica]
MGIVYEADRIAIRELELEDTELFAIWWNNGELMKDVGFRTGMGITAASLEEDFATEIADKDPFRKRRRYVVVDKKKHLPLGELVYGNLDMEKRSCGIGLKICEISQQGKGLGYETLIAFMKYLDNKFTLKVYEIDTLADNIRAYSLYKKVGFHDVKTVEKFWADQDGIFHDLIFMELKREEFFNVH